LARYDASNAWLAGKPAMMRHKIGKGWISYVGAQLDQSGQTNLTSRLLSEAGIVSTWATLPDSIEVAERTDIHRRFAILINHSDKALPVSMPTGAKMLIADQSDGMLAAHGIIVAQLAN